MDHTGIKITTRDRLLHAWENSMELVRSYQSYAHECKETTVSELFAEFAENEAKRASRLLELLHDYDSR